MLAPPEARTPRTHSGRVTELKRTISGSDVRLRLKPLQSRYVACTSANAPNCEGLTERATNTVSAKFVALDSAWSPRPHPARVSAANRERLARRSARWPWTAARGPARSLMREMASLRVVGLPGCHRTLRKWGGIGTCGTPSPWRLPPAGRIDDNPDVRIS